MKKLKYLYRYSAKSIGNVLYWRLYGWDIVEKDHGYRCVTILRAYKLSNYYLSKHSRIEHYLNSPYSMP